MSGWLGAYRAIDLTDERGLLAGQMLAKLGMDVIQVEPPGGSSARGVGPFNPDGGSCFWSAYAAGKRGVTLELRHPRGRELLLRLIDAADFLLESFQPGFLDSIGLTRETLAQRNPRLISISITPFGSDGPKKDYADAELTLWAASGPLFANRSSAGTPLRISVPQAYLHGAADGAAGALLAHFARLRTGRGQHVDISVQQSVTQATLASHLSAAVGHENFAILSGSDAKAKPGPKTVDMSGSGSRTRRSKWRVRDGLVELHLSMGPSSGGSTNNLFAWMKSEGALPAAFQDWDWKTIPQRILSDELTEDDLEAARAAVGTFLSTRSKVELLALATEWKVMLAPINSMTDLLQSPQLRSRGFFDRTREGDRDRIIPGAFAAGPVGMFAEVSGAPLLGQHNDDVYGGLLQLTAAQRNDLRVEGIL